MNIQNKYPSLAQGLIPHHYPQQRRFAGTASINKRRQKDSSMIYDEITKGGDVQRKIMVGSPMKLNRNNHTSQGTRSPLIPRQGHNDSIFEGSENRDIPRHVEA